MGLDKLEMTARLSGFLSDWLLWGEQSLAPALSEPELRCDSQEWHHHEEKLGGCLSEVVPGPGAACKCSWLYRAD